MTDLNRIQLIEKTVGYNLKRVDEGEIHNGDFYTVNIFDYSPLDVLNSGFPFKGSRRYCVNHIYAVTGLALDFAPVFLLSPEVLNALESFKKTGKPLIFTFSKDEAVKMSEITHEVRTVLDFRQKLQDLGHFYTVYDDINDPKYRFGEQLTKCLPGITSSRIPTVD